MLRAASVGLGWWSDELARAVQGKSDRIGIVSCTSRSSEKRAAFAETFGTGQHESYEALLGDPGIDAVILTTPHSRHAEHVEQAAAAGKQVFVEKPFTLTPESGARAAKACADAGVVLAVGHNRRFSAAAQALRGLLDEDRFGTLLHMEANFSAPGALSYTADRWRANRTESPAGALAGLGVHLIDLLAWLGGGVRRVMAQARRRVLTIDMDDTTSALLELGCGATAYLGSHCVCPYTSFLNIYGVEANAFAGIDGNSLEIQSKGEPRKPESLKPVDTLRTELEEFAAACAGKGTYRVAPAEAIHNVAVMQSTAKSAAQDGRAVELSGSEV